MELVALYIVLFIFPDAMILITGLFVLAIAQLSNLARLTDGWIAPYTEFRDWRRDIDGKKNGKVGSLELF